LRDKLKNSLEYIYNKYSLNNIETISNIVIQKLLKMGMEYEFWNNQKNDILFSRKIENNDLYFNIEFNKQGIRLSLFISKDKKYNIFHEELFDRTKRYDKNWLIELTKNWSRYIYDIDDVNLEDSIKNDLDTICEKISEYDKKILEINKRSTLQEYNNSK